MGFRNSLKKLFAKKDIEPVQSNIKETDKESSNSLENYCDDNPDSLECRIYDV